MGSSVSKRKSATQEATINIQTDKALYSPGNTVTGTIYLNILAPQSSTVLSLTFHGYEFLFTDVTQREYEIIRTKWRLCKWDDGLHPGHIEVPFSFILPSNLPASFHEKGTQFLAHITYRLEVTLKPKKKPVIMHRNKLVIRKPVTTVPVGYSEEKTVPLKTWHSIPRGSMTIKAHFEKRVYTERETARVALAIENYSGKLDCVNIFFSLRQRITLKEGFNKRIFELITASHRVPGFPRKSGPRQEILYFIIPPFCGDDHSFDTDRGTYNNRKLCLTTQGNIITSEFFLEVSCQMKGYKTTTPELCCPIEVSYPDPQPKDLILPLNWHPQVIPKADLGHALSSQKARKATQAQIDARLKMMETEMVVENRYLAPSNEINGLSLTGRQI